MSETEYSVSGVDGRCEGGMIRVTRGVRCGKRTRGV